MSKAGRNINFNKGKLTNINKLYTNELYGKNNEGKLYIESDIEMSKNKIFNANEMKIHLLRTNFITTNDFVKETWRTYLGLNNDKFPSWKNNDYDHLKLYISRVVKEVIKTGTMAITAVNDYNEIKILHINKNGSRDMFLELR